MARKQTQKPATDSEHQDVEATIPQPSSARKQYEERRSYPRVDFPGDVTISADGKIMSGSIRTLSAEGIQIRCTPQTASILHPPDSPIPPGEGPLVMLRFDLPVDGKEKTFDVEARLTYITPSHHDEIAFGAHFLNVSLTDKKILTEYLVEAMRPE